MDVIVHGGAGSRPEFPETRQGGLDDAAQIGSQEATPVAAVLASIGALEASSRFNAGVGGAVQSDGVVRTDAGIMSNDGAIGAACSMEGVRDAITVANLIREESPHILLSGEHALRLAEAFEIETNADLMSDRSRDRWTASPFSGTDSREQLALVNERFAETDGGTVGAVASDGTEIVAGTSTGGRWFALAGRVGDVPQVGSGFYAGPAGGISTTGNGEQIARMTLAREAYRLLEVGEPSHLAATAAIQQFGNSVSGTAGLIALTPDGTMGAATNADMMQTARAADGQLIEE